MVIQLVKQLIKLMKIDILTIMSKLQNREFVVVFYFFSQLT